MKEDGGGGGGGERLKKQDALKGGKKKKERKKRREKEREGAKKENETRGAKEDRCGKWEAPAMAPRAVIGRVEEDETSGRTARACWVAGLRWGCTYNQVYGHMGTRFARRGLAKITGCF